MDVEPARKDVEEFELASARIAASEPCLPSSRSLNLKYLLVE